MKKIKYLLLLCTLTFVLTGCVKFNANMDIKKDKSMDFSVIYAFDTSLLGNQKILEDKDKKELENQGFTVKDYSQDKMKGFTISKKIKNIDEVSSTTNTEYSLSRMVDSKSKNKYIFKVKKGLLKNTYTAKFKFDASDRGLSNSTIGDSSSSSSNLSLNSDNLDSNSSNSTIGDSSSSRSDLSLNSDNLGSNSSFNFGINSSAANFSSMMSNMDLSFNVTLPYSAKSSNASTKNNDNKSLSWNLSSTQAKAIEFEFELYNMTNIYIGAGVIALLIIIIIVVIVCKKKGNKSINGTTINSQPIQQPVSQTQNNQQSSTINQQVQQHVSQTQNNQQSSTINQQVQQPVSQTQNNQQSSTIKQQVQQNKNPFNNENM